MKKRILCLVLAVIMVLPIVLSSCNETTDEDIINNILGGDDAVLALTLSIWLPTDADPDTDEFKAREKAVEDAINDILITEKKLSTKIDIVAVNDSLYEQKIADRFVSMGTDPTKAKNIAESWKNDVQKYNPDGSDEYIYQVLFRDVLDCQMDIFLMRSYEEYVTQLESGHLHALDSYISELGAYSNVNKLIRPNIISQYKFGKSIYAIPNNHAYAQDNYQYIVIDKAIFDSYEDLSIADVTDVYSTQAFIEKVILSKTPGVVPFVGSYADAPNDFYIDENLHIGTSLKGGAPSDIYTNEENAKWISFYKSLSEKNAVKTELASGESAAVSFFYGSKAQAEALNANNEYYLVKSEMPVASTEDVFASMFAISSYSINHDRTMQILYLLQTNKEIRTLLQYGIENVDYSIVKDPVTGAETIKSKNTAYKMNPLYTGNGYYTYPSYDAPMSDWDDVKDVNFDMVVNPLVGLDAILNSNKITEAQKEALVNNSNVILPLVNAYKQGIESLSASEYAEYLESGLGEKLFVEVAKLVPLQSELNDLKAQLSEIEANNELEADVKAQKIEELNGKIATKQASVDTVNSAIDTICQQYSQFAFATELYSSVEYYEVRELYKSLSQIKASITAKK